MTLNNPLRILHNVHIRNYVSSSYIGTTPGCEIIKKTRPAYNQWRSEGGGAYVPGRRVVGGPEIDER